MVVGEITIQADLAELEKLRAFLRKYCTDANVSPHATMSVLVVTDELCSNIIRHGYRNCINNVIHVRIECSQEQCIVTMRDYSTPFDPTSVTPPLQPHLSRDKHGLYIVCQIAHIEYKPANAAIPYNTTVATVRVQ